MKYLSTNFSRSSFEVVVELVVPLDQVSVTTCLKSDLHCKLVNILYVIDSIPRNFIC